MNQFTMKTKIYQAALKAAYSELENLSTPKACIIIFYTILMRR